MLKSYYSVRISLSDKSGGVLLYQPYLIWSIVYLVKSSIPGGITWKHVLYALAVGKAATPFYYVIVLLQLTFLTPWLVGVKNRKWLYSITPLYLSYIYVYNILTGRTPSLYATLFPAWFIFYLLGIECREGKLDWLTDKINICWITAALMLSICEAYILLGIGCSNNFACSQVKVSSFLYAGLFALWLYKEYRRKDSLRNMKKNFVSKIGDISYGIFYVHYLLVWGTTKLLETIGVCDTWILYFLISFAISTVGSVLAVKSIQQIAYRADCVKALKYIGF